MIELSVEYNSIVTDMNLNTKVMKWGPNNAEEGNPLPAGPAGFTSLAC